jgi:lipopolysaccharide export system permease protein
MLFKHIDWLLIKGFFKSYAICLTSLLTLYVIVDLFMHLDEFVHHNAKGLGDVLARIGCYYGYRMPQFFDRMCEAIVLLAAMFTVATLQRNNEQVPLLSAGVSTQRIVAPVLVCACVMLGLTVANQELLIPRIGDQLSENRSDPAGEKEVGARAVYESNGIHLEADRALRAKSSVRNFRCLIPESVAGNQVHITAAEAKYVPDGDGGRWELTGCMPRGLDRIPGVLEVQDEGRYFLYTRHASFEAMVRNPKWFNMTSTWRLYEELQRPESNRLAAIAVQFHTRLTRPLLGLVLVLMGLAVILRDQNRNVFISSGLCLVLCGLFFASLHACKMLGDNELISPALAAWLPVLTFGPFAVVLFDAVHT